MCAIYEDGLLNGNVEWLLPGIFSLESPRRLRDRAHKRVRRRGDLAGM